jgi:hypothetical protein
MIGAIMDRREMLKLAAGIGLASLLPRMTAAAPASGRFFGWDENASKRSIETFIENHKYPYLSQQDHAIRGTGEGQTVLLWKAFEKVTGKAYEPHDQEIGDCVSHGFGLGVDFLTALQIEMGKPEKWVAEAATEILYGGGRVEAGGIRDTQDGSTGHWQAEFLTMWGVLLRQEYPGGHDFRKYSGKKAKEIGFKGVPDELEPLCKLHPVKTCALVKSYPEFRDAVSNGYPVAICSNVGFGDGSNEWVRDSEGFLRRKRSPWYHCMLGAAVDDNPRRPGGLIFNSWGRKWVTGPRRLEQPDGTFWVDADTLDAMLSQGDSMALSNYVGYPGLTVPDYVIWQPMPR